MEYFDSETNEHYIPYVIEPSLGCDRVALAFLCEAYDEEHLTDSKGKEDVRTVLHLHPALAPYKCAVLPLSKKLGEKAREIRNELSKYFMLDFDETGSIGKRYRREDEVGTPFCITVDFDTVGDGPAGPTTASPSVTATPWSRCVCLCFSLSDCCKQAGVDVFLWNTSERQNGGFFQNQHF